ncbi:hypothetical protein OG897_35305 [Streptomyces sp. NBC_00237]|uniref:hypothetical protein n=1 Tax=Streptomyces sp. NBC_00237 TaxID=2975687 RepID=UPI002258AFE4|nr:hypothetical protein [Streptomyces sp. NBC_00237]MCX5206661.1 hypothetical protein [Streptomyces sp. NBC_00237]
MAAFATGRLTVRALHRGPRWVCFGLPPIVTLLSGYAVAWLFWPSYYGGLFVLPWWGAALLGNITAWTCPGPRRGVRPSLASARRRCAARAARA